MGKRAKILCINPWIYDFTAYDLWSKPLGLLYVAAYLKQRGLEVTLLDCLDKFHPELLKRQKREKPRMTRYGSGPLHREVIPTPEVIQFIPRHFARYGLPEDIVIRELRQQERPDAILITTGMTYWYLGPQRIVELCRDIFPGVPILVGGIYASLMPDHAREVLQPEFLVIGPGEIQTADLLADILHLPHLREEHPTEIDDFPYPAFELYRKISYLVVMASRGCPFRCSFCATYLIDSAFSERKPEAVVEEILSQTRQFRVRDVAFYDDALLLQPEKRIKPILRQIKESKRELRFHTPNGLHARFIDEELARLMYECNFKTIRLSLESVAKERRRDIHNKITPGEMTRAVQNLVKAGYQSRDIETYIIMGLPNQPLEEVIETILYANNLGIQVRLASFSPIPGTKDYQRAIENGYLPPDSDPLITNKTVIPLFRTREAYERFKVVSQFANLLNEGVKRGVTFFKPAEFRNALYDALDKTRGWFEE